MASKVFDLIKKEAYRQKYGLEMIPSENYVSSDVLETLGSVLTNKYSEGYPGTRYYAGNFIIDEIENYTKDLANKVFKTVHANVQPYSGSPANLAVDLALVNPGETILGMALPSGGHLTHGASASFTSKLFNAVQYTVKADGKINMAEVANLAKKHKPKIIWVGGTAYPYIFDFKKFASIAESVKAVLVADISHIAGLIAGGVHPSPEPFADILTTTTHKTLRGPRGAMILVTKKGLKKDPDLASKIDKAVFPGLQGGPHDNTTAAIAIALEEALTDDFKKYCQQVVLNAKVLAQELGTSTENHLILWDLKNYGFGMGYQAHIALEMVNIFVNKNAVPGEKVSPFYPSGIRLGTPALTSRDMKEAEMKKIASWIKQALEEIRGMDTPQQKELRSEHIKQVKLKLAKNKNLIKIKQEVEKFASKYPVPGVK